MTLSEQVFFKDITYIELFFSIFLFIATAIISVLTLPLFGLGVLIIFAWIFAALFSMGWFLIAFKKISFKAATYSLLFPPMMIFNLLAF